MHSVHATLNQRRAGLLLHPTSLPSKIGSGDLGSEAYAFVDFLKQAGFSVWQTLPLGPVAYNASPYQSYSVHAGNAYLINLEQLVQSGWLTAEALQRPNDERPEQCRLRCLKLAWQGFKQSANETDRQALQEFKQQHQTWLDDYTLYQSLKEQHQGQPWWLWPEAERNRHDGVLQQRCSELEGSVAYHQFEQFLFFRQWHQLRDYANQNGILLFGDIPIFVAHDSADVWSQPEHFFLDENRQPNVVAGVPPDYFSATGQRWGNPLYRWQVMQADGFQWWLQRMRSQLDLFDLVRIDHFRGFESYWEIPASCPTAEEGQWVKAPGKALFKTFQDNFDPLPIIAEDLGIITAEVEALRLQFELPGMKILQFAFEGGASNPYLPHNHQINSVAYTGTHDNDTTLGWFETAPDELKQHINGYLGQPQETMPWPLIRSTLASVAQLAILPVQDILSLGSEDRMNIPGVSSEENWRWGYQTGALNEELAQHCLHLNRLYGRT
ncbi:MAG: 4-alpha-glucanotransferase [Gammaproteobacteria bacterium]|nr:4-alpha-glucanotransferase [Gammaproteobacteria bacterium]